MNDEPKNLPQTIDEDSLNATQSLIYRLSDQLDELKKKQKEYRDMLKGIFDNDEKLETAETAAKEATKEAKTRKEELNGTSEVKDIKLKMAEVKDDLKLVEESLNIHLVNYFQMTGSNSVDMPDGTEREFKLQARLKPAKRD